MIVADLALQITDETQPAQEGLKVTQMQIGKTEVAVSELGATSTRAWTQMAAVQQPAAALDQLKSNLQTLQADLAKVTEQPHSVKVDMQATQAQNQILALQDKLDILTNQPNVVDISADIQKAANALTLIQDRVTLLTDKPYDLNVTVDSSGKAKQGLDGLVEGAAKMAVGFAAMQVGSQIMGGVSSAIGDGINKAMGFDQVITNIGATTGATDTQLASLKDTAIALGNATDTGAASAKDAADAEFELGKAGMSVALINDGAAKATLQMKNAAADAGFGFSESAVMISDAVNGFKRDNLSAVDAANTFVGAANASSTGLAQLKLAFSAVGPVATTVGSSFKDTNTALALLAQNSLKGSDAGTSLKTMLLNLSPVTTKQKDEFDALGITVNGAGNKFFDAQGHVQNFASIAGTLHTALAGLTDQQRLTALQTMFGTDAVRAGAIIFREGKSGVDAMARAIQQEGDAAGTAAKMQDSLAGASETLSSSVDNLQIAFGEALTPALIATAKAANDMVTSAGVQEWAKKTGEGVNTLITDLGGLGDALSAVGEQFKAAGVDASKLSDSDKAVTLSTIEAQGPIAQLTKNLNDLGSMFKTVTDGAEAMREGVRAAFGQTSTDASAATDTMKTTVSQKTLDMQSDVADHLAGMRSTAKNAWMLMVNDVAATTPALVAVSANAGEEQWQKYVASLYTGFPAIDAYLKTLEDGMDIQGITGALGSAAGNAFSKHLMQQQAEGMLESAKAIRASLASLPAEFQSQERMAAADLENNAKGLLEQTNHIGEDFQKSFDKIKPPKLPKPDTSGGKAAVAETATQMQTYNDTIFKAMASAIKDTETGGKGVLAATQTLMDSLDEVTKAHIPGLKDQWTAWVKAAAAGNPPEAAKMRDGLLAELQKLADGSNQHWAVYARAAIQSMQAVEDKAATTAATIADKLDTATLKAQQAVVQNLGKMSTDIANQSATTGDVVVSLMEGLKATATAQMPQVAAVYQRALDEMNSKTPPSLAQLRTEFVTAMTALTHDPNASIAAWAQQQQDALDKLLQAQKDTDAKLLADQQDTWVKADAQQRDANAKAADAAAALALTNAKTAAAATETDNYTNALAGLKSQIDQATASLIPYQQAVIAANAALEGLKTQEEGARAGLDAANKAVSAAKAEMQGYQTQIQAAQTAMNAFAHPQLEGMGEFKTKMAANKQAINDLNLQKDLLLQAHPHASTVAIDKQIAAEELQGRILQEQNDKVYGPTLEHLRQMTEAQNELTPQQAIDGVLHEQDALKLLQAQLAASQAHVAATEQSQAHAQRAYDAASAAVKEQEAAVKLLNQALTEHQAAVAATVDQIKAQEDQLKTQHEATLKAIGDATTMADVISAQTTTLTQAVPAIATATTAIATAVTTAFGAIPAQVGPALQALGPATTLALQAVAPAIAPALAAIPPAIATGLQAVYPVWDSVFGATPVEGNLLYKLWGHGTDTFWGGLVAYTTQRVETWFDVVWVAQFDTLASKMTAYLHQKAGEISVAGGDLGVQLIQGIAAGITTSTHFVEEAAANAVTAAIAAANAAAGNPHSPAPATIPLGKSLTEGVSAGIVDGQTAAQRAMTTFLTAMLATPLPGPAAALSGPRSATTGLPLAGGVPGLGPLPAAPAGTGAPGGGFPITITINVDGLTGDLESSTTWRKVAIPISQALAERGILLNPNGGGL